MDSVRFQCQPGCIKCCDMDGFVYLSEQDIVQAAKFTGMTQKKFESRYVYRTRFQRRLRKPPDKQCPFLEKDGCSIHPAKPTQCRTFPFWPEIVERKSTWTRAGRSCPGIGKGELIQIGTAMEIADEQRRAYPELYED